MRMLLEEDCVDRFVVKIGTMRGDLKEARDAEYWGLGMARQIILFICHRIIQGCLVSLLGRHPFLRKLLEEQDSEANYLYSVSSRDPT